MAGLRRPLLSRAEPGFTLAAFERLAPPPPPDLLRARLEAGSEPGDIVADLHGRGGWVARAAIDRQRRAFSLEASPLTRLLAELVLRPPDLRHLDAAFSALGTSPHGETSLRLAITDLFATTCSSCGRTLPIDEAEWEGGEPVRLHYRCPLCRDQQHRPEHQVAEPGPSDRERAARDVGASAVRSKLRDRFPVPDGGEGLVDAILDLHTDRQLVGLAAILARIEDDLRAAPVESALRLAFLHAVLPASRLGVGGARMPTLRIAGGTIRTVVPERWRERNPWLAFEDGYRQVRAFVQRLEGASLGPLDARFGTDLRSLAEGSPNAVVRVMTPGALEALTAEAREPHRGASRDVVSRSAALPRIRLVLGQPPPRFSQERLGTAYLGTCWALGREAASLLPLEPLLGPAIRAPWSWQAAALRRSLEAVAPHLARDARVVLLLEHGGPEALVAAVLGGVGAGYRLHTARLSDPDDDVGGVVELIPAGAPPGPRTRSNVPLEPGPGDRGDPELVPAPGLFAPPERFDARPFAPHEAAAIVLETAVAVLRERGEPARYERLLGEVLVGLDRAGQLRRLLAGDAPSEEGRTPNESADEPSPAPDGADQPAGPVAPDVAPGPAEPGRDPRRARAALRRPAGHARVGARRDRAGCRPRDADADIRPAAGAAGSGRACPRPRRGRAEPSGPASRRGDRARPVVARRPNGPRGGRDPARRPR